MNKFSRSSILLLAPLLLCARGSNAQDGWFMQGPPLTLTKVCFTGSGVAIAVGADWGDTSTIRGTWGVGTFGIVMRSTDRGNTWSSTILESARWFYGLCFFDADHGIAVGAARTGGATVFRTTDAGLTWVPQNIDSTSELRAVSFADRDNGMAVGDYGAALRTTDGGITWLAQSGMPRVDLKGISFRNPGTATAVATMIGYWGSLILSTTDSGATWFYQLEKDSIELAGVSFTDDNTGTVVGGKYDSQGHLVAVIFRTTDGGKKWVEQRTEVPAFLCGVSFLDALTGFAVGGVQDSLSSSGTSGVILRTADGGATWIVDAATPDPLVDISLMDDSTRIAVESYGILFYTTDGGTNWTQRGSRERLSAVWFADASTGTAVGDHGLVLHTSNGGDVWTRQASGTTNSLAAIAFTDRNTAVAVGDSGTVIRTTNGGTSWKVVSKGLTVDLTGVSCPDASRGIAVGYQEPSSGTYNTRFLRTTDGGETWTLQTTPVLARTILNGVWFTDALNGIAVGTYRSNDLPEGRGVILRTTDGGTSWAYRMNLDRADLAAVCFPDEKHGMVVGTIRDTGIVLRSTDAGDTWAICATMARGYINGVSFLDTATGIAVGYRPRGHSAIPLIFRTTDGGATWDEYLGRGNYGLVGAHMSTPLIGTAVGWDGAIYRTTTGGETWVPQEPPTARSLPQQMRLEQNFPNPFNSSTFIEYALPHASSVNLKVYNMLGQHIATLVNETKPAGEHGVRFDAGSLASGVYFYQLEARPLRPAEGATGSFAQTKKLVVLK